MYQEVSENFVSDALERGYIQEKSYASSMQHGVYNAEDDVRMVIEKSNSGRQLNGFTFDTENEVLFKRNTKFIATDTYVKDGKRYMR
ncbi:hypothetical protein [Lactobacillus delbrueckii]|uniref:hypothetical protein n=1 Tax=Lactobacillus delbrueckii TaxID=1584 RepID=UPI0011CB3D5C|nr:hypothetical protein [Lactobacillus delbrueckii]TXG07905.1 hypothetical protein FU323_04935 [Lactobacillus delbrueckii subsp. bulgaricus]